jgi:hypothetical protein
MTMINGVDIGDVLQEALDAAKNVAGGNWSELKDIVENIGKGFINDLEQIGKQIQKGSMDEFGASIFMEDQRMVARVRLRSVAIVTLQIAENILNAMIDVFHKAVNTVLGFSVFGR